MKRKVVPLLVIVGLVALVVGIVKLVGSRSAKQGELRVEASPTASVFLDNKHLGRTPFKETLKTGEYTVKVVPETTTDQLASWQGLITIGANTLTYVNVSLAESELTTAADVLWLDKITSKQSELTVTTNPDGATVALDDAVKGITPLTVADVSPGDHTMTVTSPGFQPRTLRIKTTPGYRVITNLKLALSASGPADVAPTATPAATGKPTPIATPKKTATSSATLPDPEKPFVIIKDTPTGFLRVRMEPTTSATEAGRVKPGEKYHIEENSGAWYKIKYDGTNAGWISGQYAEKVE